MDTLQGHEVSKPYIARPRLQDPHHADLAAEKTWIRSQLLQRCGGAPEEQGIDAPLVLAGDRSQRGWKCEGHQEVRHRQEEFVLPQQPGLRLSLLTGGAVAIAA